MTTYYMIWPPPHPFMSPWELPIKYLTKTINFNNLKMRIKTIVYTLIATGLIFSGTISCSSDDEDEWGNWVDRSVLDGIPRGNAASFTVGNKGYLGTGYDGDDYLNDFWAYDMDGNFWRQLADLPGVERSAAVWVMMGTMNWGIFTNIM